MSDEIKEILDKTNLKFKIIDENSVEKEMTLSETLIQLKNDNKALLDYITNLQEELKVSQTNEETYRLEMQDITKCLGLKEDTIFDEVKEYATNLQKKNESNIERIHELEQEIDSEYITKENYKSKIDKAIEYIEQINQRAYKDDYGTVFSTQDLLEILQGGGIDE